MGDMSILSLLEKLDNGGIQSQEAGSSSSYLPNDSKKSKTYSILSISLLNKVFNNLSPNLSGECRQGSCKKNIF